MEKRIGLRMTTQNLCDFVIGLPTQTVIGILETKADSSVGPEAASQNIKNAQK